MITDMIKKILFGCIFSCFCTLIHSQHVMKEKSFLNFKYFELSDKEKDSILTKAAGYMKEEQRGDYIYKLPNGKVIFEMKGIANYLFETEKVFTTYIEASSKPQNTSSLLFTYSHPIKDTSFIEKREMYIAFFAGEYEIEFDLADERTLEKVSNLLNQIDNQQIKKYRLSLIALLGEFIVSNVEGAEWKYINIPNPQQERAPIILVGGKTLINPATIFYEEYNKRELNDEYQISLEKAIRASIEN